MTHGKVVATDIARHEFPSFSSNHVQWEYYHSPPLVLLPKWFSHFWVKDTLYKLDRHTLERNSEVFRDMFELSTSEAFQMEGKIDEDPIFLMGITVEAFDLYLELSDGCQ